MIRRAGSASAGRRPWLAVVAACLAALPVIADAQTAPSTATPVTFTESELRQILSFGPWPPVPKRDPSNRASGKPEAIRFGEKLFFSPKLSGKGDLSCASCHLPSQHWTEAKPRAIGAAPTDRNTLSLENVRLQRWFGWDGASDNLWAQSIRPLVDPREMHSTPADVADAVRKAPELAASYRRVFGKTVGRPGAITDEQVLVNLGKALAAFQETITSGRTPFDDFRDALARGDLAAAASYPEPAQRGLRIFIGRGNCSVCHTGPAFSNGEFHDIGIPYFVAGGGVDSGRHAGLERLAHSRFNLLGPYSDDRARRSATPVRHVMPQPRNFGEFRTPGLRNVARTAPFMHNGRLATLCEVVKHYSELNEERLHSDGERILKPLKLDAGETRDLLAFLDSLSDRKSDGGAPPASTCG